MESVFVELKQLNSKFYWNQLSLFGRLFYNWMLYGYTSAMERIERDDKARNEAIFSSQYDMLKHILDGNSFDGKTIDDKSVTDLIVCFNKNTTTLFVFVVVDKNEKMLNQGYNSRRKTSYLIKFQLNLIKNIWPEDILSRVIEGLRL